MAKDDVLARVAADLERGHTHVALQRLATLTATYPNDVDLRERRAALHRQVGNIVEAGRWGFLTETASPAEIAAFERAQPHPMIRLSALKVRSDPAIWAGPVAAERVRRLVDEAAVDGSRFWGPPNPGTDAATPWFAYVGCAVAIAAVLTLLGMTVVGIVTVAKSLG